MYESNKALVYWVQLKWYRCLLHGLGGPAKGPAFNIVVLAISRWTVAGILIIQPPFPPVIDSIVEVLLYCELQCLGCSFVVSFPISPIIFLPGKFIKINKFHVILNPFADA